MGETTASWFIKVEGKEVEGWRKQGCWEQNRWWWAERKEGVARLEFRPPPRPPQPWGPLPQATESRSPTRPAQANHRGPKKPLGDPGDPPAAVRQQRERAMKAVEELSPQVGTATACRSLGVPRATLYRRRRPHPGTVGSVGVPAPPPRPKPPPALSEQEGQQGLEVLHSEP